MQLWVAQPEKTRHGAPAFEHHAELPQADVDGAVATALVATYAGTGSPARHDDHLGVDLVRPAGRTTLPLDASSEHALVVAGRLPASGRGRPHPGHLGYLGVGRDEVPIDTTEPTRVLLIGGTLLDEPLLMWWNYAARGRDEITEAHRGWLCGRERFGHVASALLRIVTSGPPWSAPKD